MQRGKIVPNTSQTEAKEEEPHESNNTPLRKRNLDLKPPLAEPIRAYRWTNRLNNKLSNKKG